MPESKTRGIPRATITYVPPLAAYAWPGGYPILYWNLKTQDGFCAECATIKRNRGAHLVPDIYYEGPAEQCAECGESIESAYGDPDAFEEGEGEGDPNGDRALGHEG